MVQNKCLSTAHQSESASPLTSMLQDNSSAPKPAAASAAKSLHSCLILCDPMDGSPPGSSIPRILQAKILEWVAISFSTKASYKELIISFFLMHYSRLLSRDCLVYNSRYYSIIYIYVYIYIYFKD